MQSIISLDHPEMPPVHRDFEDWANKNSCDVATIIKRCLYGQGGYSMDLSVDKAGNKNHMQILPGHLWYADKDRPSGGPEPADFMIVGKCVGKDDLEPRRLYSGDMGDVLLPSLFEAGFEKSDINKTYLSTVLATEYLDREKTTLPKGWIDAQRILLMQQLLLVRPKVCLLMGSEAVKAVLGNKRNLTNTEGEVVEKTFNVSASGTGKETHTIKFVTSVSPGAVLHERSNPKHDTKFRTTPEQKLHKQLKFARGVLAGKEREDISAFKYETIRDTEHLERELKKMRQECQHGLVAWDAEWQGDHPQNEGSYLRCIQFAYRTDTACVIDLRAPGGGHRFRRRDTNGEWTFDGAEQEAARLCKEYMKGLRVTGHYFTADLEWLVPFGLDLRDEYDVAADHTEVLEKGGFATELAAHAWDETALFSLDDQLALHTDVPRYSAALDTEKKAAAERATSTLNERLTPFREAQRNLKQARKELRKKSIQYKDADYETKQVRFRLWRKRLAAATKAYVREARLAEEIRQEHQARVKELSEGYGWIPDEILYPYAALDAAAELELTHKYMEYLKGDRYGNDCRTAYWISHRAALVALEINCEGLRVDRPGMDSLARSFQVKRDELLGKIRDQLNWPDFNPRSKYQFAEALFGEEFNGYLQQYGRRKRTRPPGARTLRAEPLRTTGKYPKEWSQVREEGKDLLVTPNTSKQTLGEMFYSAEKLKVRRQNDKGKWRIVEEDHGEILGLLRDYRYMDQALKSLMREPNTNAQGEIETDDEGNAEYEAGIANLICGDGKVRGRVRQTLETARWAISRPSLQNQPKSRETDYSRIFGDDREVSTRSIFVPDTPEFDPIGGEHWFFVEADYTGAELLAMAIASQDKAMIDHCLRNQLPDDHPDFFDLHSNTTVNAFKFDCEPTKDGLESIGKDNLRTVGKAIAFGVAYGRGAKAIAIALRQEGTYVSVDECQATVDAFFETYPDLYVFLQSCKKRVTNPGWLANMFGRLRRFTYTADEKKLAAYQREAMNAPIQSAVADAMSTALRNIYDHRNRHGMRFRICLQIHDAVMLHVPASELAEVVRPGDGILHKCMIDQVPLTPRDLDGNLLMGGETYYFGSSIDVYDAWGKAAVPRRLLKGDVSPEVAGWKQRASGLWTHKEYRNKTWSEAEDGFATST